MVTILGMLPRIGLVVLWFLTGWMCAAMVAFTLALPAWIAPAVAIVSAAYISVWSQRRRLNALAAKGAPGRAAATAQN